MATWHRIRTYRGVFDWTSGSGHILLHTEDGNYETTALKAEEFHMLMTILREVAPTFTDGRGKIATGEEPAGANDTTTP